MCRAVLTSGTSCAAVARILAFGMRGVRVLAAAVLFAVLLMVAVAPAAWADECPAGGDHEFEASIVEPATADTDGIRQYTCVNCGYTYTDSIPRTGHAWSSWIYDVDPTCETEGHAYRVCSQHAGQSHYEEMVIAPLSPTGEHVWELVETVEPTCDEPGHTTYRCSVCGTEREDTVEPLGHEWGPWEIAVPATQDVPGIERRVCANDPTHVEERELAYVPAAGWGDTPDLEDDEGVPVNPAVPNRLDFVLLGIDVAAIVSFAIVSRPLRIQLSWVRNRRGEVLRAGLKGRAR